MVELYAGFPSLTTDPFATVKRDTFEPADVVTPSASIPLILRFCTESQILPTIVQSVPIMVINFKSRLVSKKVLVHRYAPTGSTSNPASGVNVETAIPMFPNFNVPVVREYRRCITVVNDCN